MSENRQIAAFLIVFFLAVLTSLPSLAKTSVWLDDKTELRYAKGWFDADIPVKGAMDIDIYEVEIYEKGRQTGAADRLLLKTEGKEGELVAIEKIRLENFSYQTLSGGQVAIGHISGSHLPVAHGEWIDKYRQKHANNGPLATSMLIKDIFTFDEESGLSFQLGTLSIDGVLSGTGFDQLPASSHAQIKILDMIIQPLSSAGQDKEIEDFFKRLGNDKLAMDIDIQIATEKKNQHLSIQNQIQLDAPRLAEINADMELVFSRQDYLELERLSAEMLDMPTPKTELALNLALLKSVSTLSVGVTDKGVVSLATQLNGQQETTLAIMMFQFALQEALPRHGEAIATPISAFLAQGGNLQMDMHIIPLLTANELRNGLSHPDSVIDRVKLRFTHIPKI